jgi:hypothetical protein
MCTYFYNFDGLHKSFNIYISCDCMFRGTENRLVMSPKTCSLHGTRGGAQWLNDSKHDFIMYLNFGVEFVVLSLKPVRSQSQSI